MPREATLFTQAGGSPLRGYILLKQGGGNIPPKWIQRAKLARRGRHAGVAKALNKGRIDDIVVLEDWELSFKKEQFYYGIRCLMELERDGKTKL